MILLLATTDTIVESHLNTEHGIAALDGGLEVLATSCYDDRLGTDSFSIQGTTANTVNLDAEREGWYPLIECMFDTRSFY